MPNTSTLINKPLMASVADLAIMNGTRAFAQPMHVGRPNIGSRKLFMQHMEGVLDSVWLTNNGPLVQEFEKRLAKFLTVKHCVAMCNATIALEIAIRATGMQGEVIVPSFTFIATAHALQWQGITPVFCDVDPNTHNLDPDKLESLVTPRTSGILGVHVWGRPCAVDDLAAIARQHELVLLFDAAHALGCSYQGQMIGGLGTAEVFSFHATKFFNTFEGGAVTTNDDDLAEKMRLMRNFGFSGHDNVIYIGTNGKMPEPSAAMGLTNLESFDTFVEQNRRNYLRYQQGLAAVDGVTLIEYDESECNNYQYIVLEIDASVTGIHRDRLVDVLMAENVLARCYFYPGCHQMEPYRSYYPSANLLVPETEYLTERVLSLPTGNAVGDAEVDQICSILRLAIEHSTVVNEAIEQKETK